MISIINSLALAFVIALNGAPKTKIIVADDCHSAERFAAEDLQHWINEISGAKVPLESVSGRASQKGVIYVGGAFAEGVFDDDLKTIGESDGFAIREKDGSVYLFGTKPRASIYATSTFLEENTDIIWARPSEAFGTVFSKNPNLDFTMTDRLELPAFETHGWNVVAIRRDYATAKWVVRNRGNKAEQAEPKGKEGTLGFIRDMGGHIYWWMAHPTKYFKTNPEFYSYSKLKKTRVPETLCVTAPGLVDVAVKNLADRIAAGGGEKVESLGIGFRDSWLCCQCDKCTAPIPLKDGSTLQCKSLNPEHDPKYYSTRFWLFIGEIAKRLKAIYPKMKFIGSGYMYAAEPPACDIPDFMYVSFCPIGEVDSSRPLLDENQKPRWRNRLLEWNRRFPGRVFFYEYWCSYSAGFAGIRSIKRIPIIRQNLLDLKNVLKGFGIESELTPDSPRTFSNHSMESEWDACSIDRWILARLIWDPAANVNQLAKRYISRTYREAAPLMRKFYVQLMKNEWDDSVPRRQRNVFNCKEPEKARRYLAEALEAARHPNSRKMIERLIGQWEIAREKHGVRTVPMMSKEEHFREPGATCWETCLTLPEFKVPGYFTWGVAVNPAHKTEVRMLTDGTSLFLRLDGKVGKKGGDWVYLSLFPKEKNLNPWRVKHPFDGKPKVFEIPLRDLGIDRSDRGTYPTYYFLRYDAESGEESTVDGAKFGVKSGTVSF